MDYYKLNSLIDFYLLAPIYRGTAWFGVSLIILCFFPAAKKKVFISELTAAAGILAVSSFYIYLLLWITLIILAYFLGCDHFNITFMGNPSGKYWWVFIMRLFAYCLFPHLVFIKRIRVSPKYALLIFIPWLGMQLLPWFTLYSMIWYRDVGNGAWRIGNFVNWNDILEIAIYILMLFVAYKLLTRRPAIQEVY